jgi:uncharacterized membrane protein
VSRYEKTLDIAAPAKTVFAVLEDVEGWPNWTATMLSVKRADAGALKVGSSARVQQPKLKAALWTVNALDPGRNFTWGTRSLGLRMEAAHLVESTEGGCRVTLSFEVSGLLKGLVTRLYGPLIEEYVGIEAEGLKRHCEQRR